MQRSSGVDWALRADRFRSRTGRARAHINGPARLLLSERERRTSQVARLSFYNHCTAILGDPFEASEHS